jgi:signal transduction histidine kinase
VQHCRNILSGRFESKLRFLFEVNNELPMVRVVESQIFMALLNIMLNAAESTHGKVTIKVEAFEKSGHVIIRVTDNGDGMSEATLQRAFEPFHSENKDSTHFGLGLCIANGIIKDHSGVLRLYSEQGKGSRATVALPVYETSKADAPDLTQDSVSMD